MAKLVNKTALVTGSSRGIGRAIAERLASEGALVAVHYATSSDAAAAVVKGIESEGGRAFTLQAELGIPGDVDNLVQKMEDGLKERTGSAELDILVNNAAIMRPVALENSAPKDFDELVAVNMRAPFFLVQRVLSLIPDAGRIINISSGLTRTSNPDNVAYAMTKGALEQMTFHLAKHLGSRRITINSVAPGITNNGGPMFSDPGMVEQMAQFSIFNRVGEPSDIGDVVAFLASDDARWITGSFIDATGGSLLG